MKEIEGHFNPLKRPDRTIYSCGLTVKVQLDLDEREWKGDTERTRQQKLGWSLSHSHLNMQEVSSWRTKKTEGNKMLSHQNNEIVKMLRWIFSSFRYC